MMDRWVLAGLVAVAFSSGAAAAAPGSAEVDVLAGLVNCRAIAGIAERVACYDTEIERLKQAQTAGDLVAYNRSQIQGDRRSSFGLSEPKVRVPGSRGEDRQNDLKEIASKIAQVSTDREGRLIFVLENGARWRQTDSLTLARRALPGQPVRIRAASMGSYLINVDGQKALRVRREK
jgi:hypothetical protein